MNTHHQDPITVGTLVTQRAPRTNPDVPAKASGSCLRSTVRRILGKRRWYG